MKTCFHKAIFIFIFILIYIPSFLKAQSFKEGDNTFSIGYGFGVIDATTDDVDLYNNTGSSVSFTGPFYFKYENAVTDKVSIGINVAYGQYQVVTPNDYYYSYPYSYQETQTFSSFSALARLNWHFGKLNKFDPYWGLGVGYRYSQLTTSDDPNVTANQTSETYFPLGFEITIGARYYVSNNVAFYMETGLAKSVVQIGLSFKLNDQRPLASPSQNQHSPVN